MLQFLLLLLNAALAQAQSHRIVVPNITYVQPGQPMMNLLGVPPAFPASSLPAELQGRNLVGSTWIPILVEGGNVTMDGQIQLIFNSTRVKGVRATPTRGLLPGEAVCATIEFPSMDYGGVSMTFYGLESPVFTTDSANDGSQDEIDIFEMYGSATKFQTNWKPKGDNRGSADQQYLTLKDQPQHDVCLYFDDKQALWFFDGTLSQTTTEYIFISQMWIHFTVWNTIGKWQGCCGDLVSEIFLMNIARFSIFSTDPNITYVPPAPATTSTTSTLSASPTDTIRVNVSFNAPNLEEEQPAKSVTITAKSSDAIIGASWEQMMLLAFVAMLGLVL